MTRSTPAMPSRPSWRTPSGSPIAPIAVVSSPGMTATWTPVVASRSATAWTWSSVASGDMTTIMGSNVVPQRRLAHGAGDHEALDLVGALVDLRDLRVAHHPLDGVLVHVAVAAEHLDGLDRDRHRGVRGEQLGHRRPLAQPALVAVRHRARLVEQFAGGRRPGLHVGELELDALEVVDRLAERDPLLGVLVRVVGRALGDADRLRRGAQARALEHGERHRQALALDADEVLVRHAHVLEDRGAGRRALDAELVLELGDAEALAVLLDDERAEAPLAVALLGCRAGEDDVEVGDRGVRDPVLRAVDDPLVAVADGGRAQGAGVRAGLRLGQAERRRPLPAGALRQEALLELVGAEHRDRQRAELLDHQDQRARRARARDLLDGDLQHERAGSRAAELRSEREREDVLLGEQPADVPGVLAGTVDVRGPGTDAFVHDLADRCAEILVLLGQVVDVADGRRHDRDASPTGLRPTTGA